MKELNIQEIKDIELDILKKFDSICKENNLKYSLAYGTMIGAVRHHGFIPWDDDIDVFMKREDYEKLLNMKYDDGLYEIKSYRYSKNYYYPFSKMINKKTKLIEPKRCDKYEGVYIDIFPLDEFVIENNEDLLNIFNRAKKLSYSAFKVGEKISTNKRFSLRYFFKVIYQIITYPFKKQIIERLDRYCRSTKKGNYAGFLLYPEYPEINQFYKKEVFENIDYIEFEDSVFPIYSDYDKILKQYFGDYMKFPPVEEQVSNHEFKAFRLN